MATDLDRNMRAASDPPSRTPNGLVPRTKLDLEPNPFERSFSGKSDDNVPTVNRRQAKSTSPTSHSVPRLTPKLPGISAMASPSDLTGFGWNMETLRSGPLSPGMLTGPLQAHHHQPFDPTQLRTGLTPYTEDSQFPPPSPATAALFAMMTNSQTPGTTLQKEGNHFDSSFATANSNKYAQPQPRPLAALHRPHPATNGRPPSTLNPNAIHPPRVLPQGPQNPLYLLSSQAELAPNDDAVMAATALSTLNSAGGMAYINTLHQAQSQPLPPTNGYTIDTTDRRPSEVSNGSPTLPPAPVAAPQARGGRKKAATAAAPAPVTGKRKKADTVTPAPKKGKKPKAAPPMDDEDDFENMEDWDDGASNGGTTRRKSDKFETEEEKRKNFLERNRQAALKCRQRKKAWLQELQAKVENLTADNETLTSTVTSLREEITNLRSILLAHKDCQLPAPTAVTNGAY